MVRLPWLAIAALAAMPVPARSEQYLVDSVADTPDAQPGNAVCDDGDGACTLRAALQECAANLGYDQISFAIPGPGLHTINISSPLPDLSDHAGTTVDGSSQPGFAGTPLIEIDGTEGAAAWVFKLTGGHGYLRSLIINNAGTHGVIMSGSHLNTVAACWIGLDGTGAAAKGNQGHGVHVSESSQNLIGGSGDGNVIAGNGGTGILISGSSAFANTVVGNQIGTDAAGTRLIPNALSGIHLDGAPRCIVGESGAGGGNVVVASPLAGIRVSGAGATGNRLHGNIVGTDPAGAAGFGNGTGILIEDAPATEVGTAVAGNIVAGNLGPGIQITGAAATGCVVVANRIGISGSSAALLPNSGDGIEVTGGAGGVRIGDTTSGEGNTIAGNGRSGIRVESGAGTRIAGNSIYANGELGIDLGGDRAPTPDDAGDGDAGANDLQNAPAITAALAQCARVTIDGTLDSAASASFDIDLYASPACDSSGYGEGARWLGRVATLTDPSGLAGFQATIPARINPGEVLTATATDAGGSSSEFSPCLTPVEGCTQCGNGQVDAGEDCDSSGVDTTACDADCTLPVCGDGHRNDPKGEQCDDGNTRSGDGCSALCQSEGCQMAALSPLRLLRAIKLVTDTVALYWSADPAASAYHVNAVFYRAQLSDPRRGPEGMGSPRCEAVPPQSGCIDPASLSAPPSLVFYQALSACGPSGSDEGPF